MGRGAGCFVVSAMMVQSNLAQLNTSYDCVSLACSNPEGKELLTILLEKHETAKSCAVDRTHPRQIEERAAFSACCSLL